MSPELIRSRRGKRAWARSAALLVLSLAVIAGPAGALATSDSTPAKTLLTAPDGPPFDPGTGWSLKSTSSKPDRLDYAFEHADGYGLDIRLVTRDDARQAFERSASFNISYSGKSADRWPAALDLLKRFSAHVVAHDDGRVELSAPRRETRRQSARGFSSGFSAQFAALPGLDRAQVGLTLVLLLLLSVVVVSRAIPVLVRELRELGTAARYGFLAFIGLGVLLRLIVPIRLVMVYMGYKLTSNIADFGVVSKYGAGAATLYRVIFGVTGPDHRVLVWTNTVAGIATLFLVPLVARRLFRRDTVVAPLAAIFALTPLFVKDHRSESLLVLGGLFLWLGLFLVLDLIRDGRISSLLGAVAALALAASSRPELLLVTPLALAATVHVADRQGLRERARLLLPGLVLLGAAMVPHVLHLRQAASQQLQAGALMGFDVKLLERLSYVLRLHNGWLNSAYFPLGITALALVAPLTAARGERRGALAWAFVALVWTAVYYVDIPETSIPRLHAPAALIVVMLAAFAIARLYELVKRRQVAVAGRWALGAVLILVLALSALPSIPSLWAPTNEDTEERLLQRALAAMPGSPSCLVHIGDEDDPPKGNTHRHFPDYLFREPHRGDRVKSIRRDQGTSRDEYPGGTYFFLGLRCYAAWMGDAGATAIHRSVDVSCLFDPDCWRMSYARADKERSGKAQGQQRSPMLSSCARLLEGAVLEPVFEEDVPNLGDNEFGAYPDVASFRTGLYRLKGMKPER